MRKRTRSNVGSREPHTRADLDRVERMIKALRSRAAVLRMKLASDRPDCVREAESEIEAVRAELSVLLARRDVIAAAVMPGARPPRTY